MTSLLSVVRSKLYCLKKDHMKQQICYICTSDKCEMHELCCYLCQSENHKSHEMANIKIFIAKILQFKTISAQSLYATSEADQIINRIDSFIFENAQQLDDLANILNSFKKYAQIKKNNLLSILNLSEELQNITNHDIQQFQKQLTCFFQKYAHYFDAHQDKTNILELDLFFNNLNVLKQQFSSIVVTLEKYKKQNKINDNNILSLFSVQDQRIRIFRPRFSQSLKANCMKITATTAQMQTSASQRILALEPSLQINSKTKKWKVKIIKLASWIGLGACHINKLKQANWHFNYSNPKHGSYFISSNGYSWSSYKPEFNSKNESFSFKTGDIISIQFNPRQKKIKYEKQADNVNYSIQVQLNGDPLHPAINLTGVGDSVQIIV